MVTKGDKCLLVPYKSGGGIDAAIFPYRLPSVGSRVLIVHVAGQDAPFFLKPYRAYKGDQVLMVPIHGNPNNVVMIPDVSDYMPETWQTGGITCSCTEPTPTTEGWQCGTLEAGYSRYDRNKVCIYDSGKNPCRRGAKIAGGDPFGDSDRMTPEFCNHRPDHSAIREQYRYEYWEKNKWYVQPVYEYSCYDGCIFRGGCPSAGNVSDTFSPPGCRDAFRYRVKTEKVPGHYMYDCIPHPDLGSTDGGTCPNYNGGTGIAPCTQKSASAVGPRFTYGQNKNNVCQNPGKLVFLGWTGPGASDSESISCLFGKASEVVEATADPDMNIVCKFRRGSTEIGTTITTPNVATKRIVTMTPGATSSTNQTGAAGTTAIPTASVDLPEIDYDPGDYGYDRRPPRRTKSATLHKANTKRT